MRLRRMSATTVLLYLQFYHVEYPSDLNNQNPYLIDEEQSNLLLYNKYLEEMKASNDHTNEQSNVLLYNQYLEQMKAAAHDHSNEQSNLMLYNQYLEQMKATHDHTNYKGHPFMRLKEKFKKLFSRHKKEPEQNHEGILMCYIVRV